VKGPAPDASPDAEVDDGRALDFDALYHAHAQDVARWAARLGGPTVDAEDVAQEVFLIVHRQIGGWRGEARPTTWLYRITENVVRHRRRKERWRRWLGGSADEVAGDRPSPALGPLAELERKQAAALVYRALDGLPEKQRSALILFELEGATGDEIAELLGARPATVWVWLHRARAKFLERLTALDEEAR
jgi:RNA polymerase sigma-70 factor (ECF subfamily)